MLYNKTLTSENYYTKHYHNYNSEDKQLNSKNIEDKQICMYIKITENYGIIID